MLRLAASATKRRSLSFSGCRVRAAFSSGSGALSDTRRLNSTLRDDDEAPSWKDGKQRDRKSRTHISVKPRRWGSKTERGAYYANQSQVRSQNTRDFDSEIEKAKEVNNIMSTFFARPPKENSNQSDSKKSARSFFRPTGTQQQKEEDTLRRKFLKNPDSLGGKNKSLRFDLGLVNLNTPGPKMSSSQKGEERRSTDSSPQKFDSPLSEFLQSMLSDKNKNVQRDSQTSPKRILDYQKPKWRLQSQKSRESTLGLRQQRQDDKRKRIDGRAGRRPDSMQYRRSRASHIKKTAPVFVDPKSLIAVIPNHSLSLSETSRLFREKAIELRKTLRSIGEYSKEDHQKSDEDLIVGVETMELIAIELGRSFQRAKSRESQDDEALLMQRRAAANEEVQEGQVPYESLPPRPPVVCIMGHVDHGKTTLMDALRRRAQGGVPSSSKKKKKDKGKAKGKGTPKGGGDVAGTEAGGITQVISAFQVPLLDHAVGAVTFLDTPGHAAFKTMRQSGSDAADILVLVIAADDGVSEQTVEILDFYKSIITSSGGSGISLVIAMNKIDKPGIEVDEARMRIESQLLEHGILTEGMPSDQDGEYGPPVQLVPVSGLTGQGLDDLIEGLVLQSEVMDLRADDSTRCEGIIMDAKVDKGLGIVADCIIRWGSLEKGNIVVSGTNTGKVRLLKDVSNKQLLRGVPSQPVRIIGFDTVPKAGEPIVCVASEEAADQLIASRQAALSAKTESVTQNKNDAEIQSAGKHLMNFRWREAFEEKHGLEGEDESQIRIPVILRADADGTLDAIRDSLVAIADESTLNVCIDPIKVGVGPLHATDIEMAKECGASIFCFNLKNEQTIASMAESEGISLVSNDVIYRLLEDAKNEFVKHFPCTPFEIVHGRGKVQAVFDIGGIENRVAGLNISEGIFYREKCKGKNGQLEVKYRVFRDGKPLTPMDALGATSLKHFKNDVNELSNGKDCGLSLDGFDNYQTGDVIECFSIEMRQEFV